MFGVSAPTFARQSDLAALTGSRTTRTLNGGGGVGGPSPFQTQQFQSDLGGGGQFTPAMGLAAMVMMLAQQIMTMFTGNNPQQNPFANMFSPNEPFNPFSPASMMSSGFPGGNTAFGDSTMPFSPFAPAISNNAPANNAPAAPSQNTFSPGPASQTAAPRQAAPTYYPPSPPSAPPPAAPAAPANYGPIPGNSANERIVNAMNRMGNFSSRSGPNGGYLACAWSVNKVLEQATGKKIGKNPNLVASVEQALKDGEGVRIPPDQVREGDIAIISKPGYEKGGGTAHIGIVNRKPDGKLGIKSNSSPKAEFSLQTDLKFSNIGYNGHETRYYRVKG